MTNEVSFLLKYDLVDGNDPILREETVPFDFSNPPLDPQQLAIDLADVMVANKGLGIAANQIGLNYRIFALTGNPVRVCFNPRIVNYSDDTVTIEEGCLSFPGLHLPIKRPSTVRLRYTMVNGETVTEQFTGLTARVIQHEMDHLDGILFYNRASRYHRDKAFKRLRKA